jgi:hypothetical protein
MNITAGLETTSFQPFYGKGIETTGISWSGRDVAVRATKALVGSIAIQNEVLAVVTSRNLSLYGALVLHPPPSLPFPVPPYRCAALSVCIPSLPLSSAPTYRCAVLSVCISPLSLSFRRPLNPTASCTADGIR